MVGYIDRSGAALIERVMAKSLISLGANLGNPRQVMRLAGQRIVDRFGVSNVTFSQLYRTPAVGGPIGQDDFYNAAATITSTLTAFEVWRELNLIEQSLGRQRRRRWEARQIDLDILLHDEQRHWTPTLKVPHPRMVMRTFVLEPAREIAAQWIEPVTSQSIDELCKSLRQFQNEDHRNTEMIHILVISENIELVDRIGHELVETTNDSRFIVEKTNARDSSSSNRCTVRWNDHRQATIQSIDPLARPISRSQIVSTRLLLNQKIIEHQANHPLHLLVFAGSSPDPDAIHWEDYCRRWAELLGMDSTYENSSETESFSRLPKYLLSADDAAWAAHELLAAMTAMTCPVQSSGAFFDV